MDSFKGWMTCKEVMEYLKINEFELAVIVHNCELTAHAQNLQPVGSFYVTPDSIYDMIFKYDEVERNKKQKFTKTSQKKGRGAREEDHLTSSEPLIGEEVIDLKTMISEEPYLDEAIPAAVAAGIFIAKQKFPVTKKILLKILINEGVSKISGNIFDKIWRSIPEEMKNEGESS